MKSMTPVKKYVIVDLTNIESPSDVYAAFVKAKCGVEPITREEMLNYPMHVIELMNSNIVKSRAYLVDYIDELTDIIESIYDNDDSDDAENDVIFGWGEENEVEKKPNIFKRFWNWITRKK